MPCRFASSGTVATSRSASMAILALNVASNFLRDLVISVLHRLRQSRTLHTLTFGPISGVHFKTTIGSARRSNHKVEYGVSLLGVTTAVSLYVATYARFLIWLNGALNWLFFVSTENSYMTA